MKLNKIRTYISFLLSVVFLIVLVPPAVAQEFDTLPIQQVAEQVITDFGEYTIAASRKLYNVSGELEAYLYSFEPIGYVIVNVNDYSVPEFSPTASCALSNLNNTSKAVYNGPLFYLEMTEQGYLRDIKTQQAVNVEDLPFIYSARDDNKTLESAIDNDSISSTRTIISEVCSVLPPTWNSSYFCGVDAVAIVLNQLHRAHYSINISSINKNDELQQYLVDNYYIVNSGTFASDLVNGWGNYKGINALFADLAMSSLYLAYYNNYSLSIVNNMRSSFRSNYPVILGTENLPGYIDHWLIAYGYYFNDMTAAYWIVNDGWGSNDIYVDTYSGYYDEVIFFNGR